MATGLALALVRQRRPDAVLCELGDGAVNMGAWHESLNLAALWDLPIVFLVVDNGYGMGTAVERASAEPHLYRRASAFRMHGERVDGDDLDAVVEAADRLLGAAHDERRPAVLEAMTYRYRGHSVADAGLAYRSRQEIANHTVHDPIVRVREQLRADGVDEEELDAIDRATDERVAAAVEAALASPEPPLERHARRGQRSAVRADAPGQRVRRGGADIRRGARDMSTTAKPAPVPRIHPRIVSRAAARTDSQVMTYREALRMALREELARDHRVFLMGEEVGLFDGAYKVSAGLLDEFGADRVRDTPISEEASWAPRSAQRCSASARSWRS